MEIKSINIEGLIKYNRIKAQDIKSEALIPKSLSLSKKSLGLSK